MPNRENPNEDEGRSTQDQGSTDRHKETEGETAYCPFVNVLGVEPEPSGDEHRHRNRAHVQATLATYKGGMLSFFKGTVLIDTGQSLCYDAIVSYRFAKSLGFNEKMLKPPSSVGEIRTANQGGGLTPLGALPKGSLHVDIGGLNPEGETKWLLLDVLVLKELAHPVNFGMKFARRFSLNILGGEGRLTAPYMQLDQPLGMVSEPFEKILPPLWWLACD